MWVEPKKKSLGLKKSWWVRGSSLLYSIVSTQSGDTLRNSRSPEGQREHRRLEDVCLEFEYISMNLVLVRQLVTQSKTGTPSSGVFIGRFQ